MVMMMAREKARSRGTSIIRSSERQGTQGKPALRADVVRSPDDPGAVFKDHPHSDQRKDLHGLGKVNDSIDDDPLEEVADEEKDRRH